MKNIFIALLVITSSVGLSSSIPNSILSGANFEDDIDLDYLNFEKALPCFERTDDADGDGYARKGATPIMTDRRGPFHLCPKEYVNFGNDCDDENSDVHPFNQENPFNRIDDDCDAQIDEAVFNYERLKPQPNELQTEWKLSNLETKKASKLVVEFATLAQPLAFKTLEFKPATTVTLTGLLPLTAYRLRATFYDQDLKLGSSDWAYAVTSETSELAQARSRLANFAIKEWQDSEDGKTGYRGSEDIDGTRYESYENEWWCSEFYSWVATPWLDGVEGRGWVGALRSFFANSDNDHEGHAIPKLATTGDYLAIATLETSGLNHSAMILAVEPTDEHLYLWTIEGNVKNKTRLKRRKYINPDRLRLGHLDSQQLRR